MKQKEWVAVFVAVFVVGFFFIFGNTLISAFSAPAVAQETIPQVAVSDTQIGGGEMATTGKRITVHYTGRLSTGEVFDSSVERKEPFQFVLGVGQVIKGWDDGIAGMREGGKRILIIPPQLGYGSSKYGPIPSNSTLVFEIELLKVEN